MENEVDYYVEVTNEEYQVSSQDYGELIIEMVHRIDDEKFLKQIYTIMHRHIKKEG